MHDFLALSLTFVGGIMLGALYFSGLWFTLRRIRQEKHPAAWVILSMVVRMVLLLGAFFLMLRYGGWVYLLTALAGFIVLRVATTRGMQRQLHACAEIQE